MGLLSKKNNKKYNRKYSKKNKYNMLGGMKIVIRLINGRSRIQDVNADETVDSLRSMLASEIGIKPIQLGLIYNHKNLDNGHSLNDYAIEDGSVIHSRFKLLSCVDCSKHHHGNDMHSLSQHSLPAEGAFPLKFEWNHDDPKLESQNGEPILRLWPRVECCPSKPFFPGSSSFQ